MIDNPRLDLVLAKYGRSIVVVLVGIGILAFLASGWVVATPSTSTSHQYADERVSSDVDTSAVVVRNGTLWNEGDRLENSGVYILNASPELTLRPETRLTNATAEAPVDDGTVSHELTLRFEATREGTAFWNETRTLVDESPAVENGVARSETTIDVESVRDRQREIERELSGVGTVDVRLEFRAAYETGAGRGVQEASTTLEITDDAYWMADSLSASDERRYRTGTTVTTESRNLGLIAGLSLLGTLSLAAAVSLARRSPVDEAAARRAVHERRYAEWISRGSIPMWIGDYHVSLDTLEDVVDVAIDTNERVVHDTQRGLFAVVNDGVVYYYSDRGLWEETAWPEMDLDDGSAVVDADAPLNPEELELEGSDEFSDPDDGFDDDADVWRKL
ncbi:DUF5305 domain-containing protein [Haloterrigena sp. SYSU A121-1]|uniref:DUF5305 domain-containing protein n=1 Tax=Haloterrigena gelatinilytica TaxID=2741724 RepID=A0A8J8GK51_9EURY|nr:DUF5305 domain-containing protein [Haloterrigena gelatinilytica]NUB89814.1 DUF5305 domain-containing protein [Haloterrigena gelatinilytica]